MERDILLARAEELPEDLPAEEIYSRLFAPAPPKAYPRPQDILDLRRQAWRQGMIMRQATAGSNAGSKARLEEIQAYMAWLKYPADALAEQEI